jgi:hypothetical protein
MLGQHFVSTVFNRYMHTSGLNPTSPVYEWWISVTLGPGRHGSITSGPLSLKLHPHLVLPRELSVAPYFLNTLGLLAGPDGVETQEQRVPKVDEDVGR